MNLCCEVEAPHLDVPEKRDLVAVRGSRTDSMRYFSAKKCQNLCTKQCSYKVEWGWERSWVNRKINLAEKNRNLSHVKTCLFMNIIRAIIFLSSLPVPEMAARGATWPRTSIRCEAVWCHRIILSLNANDFQGWLQAIINHFVLRATSSFTSGTRTSGTCLGSVLLSAISHVVFQNKPNWERWSKISFFPQKFRSLKTSVCF